MTTASRTLRWAAYLLSGYAVLVVVNATVMQARSGWADIASYPRALVRAAGVAIVVWGLLRHGRWAWWLGLVLAAFWAVTGMLGLGVLLSIPSSDRELVPAGILVVGGASVVLLGVAVAMLLLPSTRRALRQPPNRPLQPTSGGPVELE
jgi:hypothetical protein